MNLKTELNQINLLNFLSTPRLVNQMTIPTYPTNYWRKGACLITLSQLENKPGCKLSPSSIGRCYLTDGEEYKPQLGSLRHFPNLSFPAGKRRYCLHKRLALSWHIFNMPVQHLLKQLLGPVLHSSLYLFPLHKHTTFAAQRTNHL